ncbi:MAG: hypothetical protein ACRDL7_03095 [Gaiellaceae bacterium]
MASTVESIANNDPALKELRLGESFEHYFADVTEIVDALRDNQKVVYL